LIIKKIKYINALEFVKSGLTSENGEFFHLFTYNV